MKLNKLLLPIISTSGLIIVGSTTMTGCQYETNIKFEAFGNNQVGHMETEYQTFQNNITYSYYYDLEKGQGGFSSPKSFTFTCAQHVAIDEPDGIAKEVVYINGISQEVTITDQTRGTFSIDLNVEDKLTVEMTFVKYYVYGGTTLEINN